MPTLSRGVSPRRLYMPNREGVRREVGARGRSMWLLPGMGPQAAGPWRWRRQASRGQSDDDAQRAPEGRMSEAIDLAASLERLGRTVAAKQATDPKRLAWQRIQSEAPDHAELLRAITAGFGKPARVRVVIGGERVL